MKKLVLIAGAGSSVNAANSGTSASTNNYQPLRGTGVIGSGAYNFSDTRNQSTSTSSSSSNTTNSSTEPTTGP